MIRGYTPPADIGRVRNLALGVGGVLTLLLLGGALFDRGHFFHGYLVGFIFWTGVTVGSLALLMLQHLTGGAWGLVIRRVLEASTRTLPLMLLLFIPVAIGLRHIYPWTDAAVMSTPALQKKTAFLNPSFFIIRAFVYFAIWSGLAMALNWLSLQQDRATGRDHVEPRHNLREERRVPIRHAGDHRAELDARCARGNPAEQRVRLEHRVGRWPDIADLVVVVHHPERVEAGLFRGQRDLGDALEQPVVGHVREREARQLEPEVHHHRSTPYAT